MWNEGRPAVDTTTFDADILATCQNIKHVKDAIYTGWNPALTNLGAEQIWEYNSASSIKISESVNYSSVYMAGAKLTFEQSTGGVKYFRIVSSSYSAPDFVINLDSESLYVVENEEIVNPKYSYSSKPQDYPLVGDDLGTIQSDIETIQSDLLAWKMESDPIGRPKLRFALTASDKHLLLAGGTIGDSSSAASVRANDDTTLLFHFLWDNVADGQCAVIGGRGVSAAADWAAHKKITLPDLRGKVLVCLDNLGGSSANVITGSWADLVAGTGGTETHTLDTTQIPAHTHSNGVQLSGTGVGGNGGTWVSSLSNTGSAGGGLPHPNVQPSMAVAVEMRYKY